MWEEDNTNVNPISYTFYWGRNKYYAFKNAVKKRYYNWLCSNGFHVTYNMSYKFSQLATNSSGERLSLKSALRNIRPVMRRTCSRCGKQVNNGIPDEYFHGKRDFS